jgi:hypothetical protein
MKQNMRKALVVAMVVGGAALTPMAANAAEGLLCADGIAEVSTLATGSDYVCVTGDRSCGRTKVAGPNEFLWSGDRDGIIGKASSATSKALAKKYGDAAKIMGDVAGKATTLVSQGKLDPTLGLQLATAALDAQDACKAGL